MKREKHTQTSSWIPTRYSRPSQSIRRRSRDIIITGNDIPEQSRRVLIESDQGVPDHAFPGGDEFRIGDGYAGSDHRSRSGCAVEEVETAAETGGGVGVVNDNVLALGRNVGCRGVPSSCVSVVGSVPRDDLTVKRGDGC